MASVNPPSPSRPPAVSRSLPPSQPPVFSTSNFPYLEPPQKSKSLNPIHSSSSDPLSLTSASLSLSSEDEFSLHPSSLPPLLPTPTVCLQKEPNPKASPNRQSYTWASRVASTPRSLTKIQNQKVSTPDGKPRVKIPNEVFLKGATYHKDFIVALFYDDSPRPGQVRGVLNYLWGKDIKLEIHQLSGIAYLIRIPSDSLREKILLKEIWTVGESWLYVGAWKPEYSLHPPSIEITPIWVHFSGLPFDLLTREGLSYVGSLIGDPLDVDEFTKKIKSHDTAHVKIEVDLSKPLPDSVEIEKEDGTIILVTVSYPNLPPLCQICKQIGHKDRRCPLANFQWMPRTSPKDNQTPTLPLPSMVPTSVPPLPPSTVTKSIPPSPDPSPPPNPTPTLVLAPISAPPPPSTVEPSPQPPLLVPPPDPTPTSAIVLTSAPIPPVVIGQPKTLTSVSSHTSSIISGSSPSKYSIPVRKIARVHSRPPNTKLSKKETRK